MRMGRTASMGSGRRATLPAPTTSRTAARTKTTCIPHKGVDWATQTAEEGLCGARSQGSAGDGALGSWAGGRREGRHVYDSSPIWSRELMAASLLPRWASSTERITSRSMLGNMSWMAFRSSSLQRGWALTAGGSATGTTPGLHTAGIPASRVGLSRQHLYRGAQVSPEVSPAYIHTTPGVSPRYNPRDLPPDMTTEVSPST